MKHAKPDSVHFFLTSTPDQTRWNFGKIPLSFDFAIYSHLYMKPIFILSGLLFVVLGGIGVVVPGLPTTPFLLAALYCFGKSSERLHTWFLGTKIYQKYLKEYDQRRAMTMKQKISILAFAAPFCIFAFFALPNIWGKIAMILVIIFQYYYFFFKIKTIR